MNICCLIESNSQELVGLFYAVFKSFDRECYGRVFCIKDESVIVCSARNNQLLAITLQNWVCYQLVHVEPCIGRES